MKPDCYRVKHSFPPVGLFCAFLQLSELRFPFTRHQRQFRKLTLERKCSQNSTEFSTTKIRASESSRIFEIISVRLISLPPDSENNSDDDEDDEFDNSDGNNIFSARWIMRNSKRTR